MGKKQVSKELPSVEKAWKGFSWWKKALVNCGMAVCIGEYAKPGWSDTKFFIFRCPKCRELHISYRQALHQSLFCNDCGAFQQVILFLNCGAF